MKPKTHNGINYKPVLFNGEMVRAILDGRKTQTRRPAKLNDAGRVKLPGSHKNWHTEDADAIQACPFGKIGDYLWVRETFYCDDCRYPNIPESDITDNDWRERMIYYAADGPVYNQICECEGIPTLIPSIHMPLWAGRIVLEITSIRLNRVKDISEEDAIAEGCEMDGTLPKEQPHKDGGLVGWDDAREWFSDLWDQAYHKAGLGWDQNPLVWVVEFKHVKGATKGA